MDLITKKYLLENMKKHLNNTQFRLLIKTIRNAENIDADSRSINLQEKFLEAKIVEGCSTNTINYYKLIISKFEDSFNVSATEITTDEIRDYLLNYEKENSSSKTTMDNIRRILSSYYNWLEDEDYIIKSPVRRIHKVKTKTIVKETISDEEIELLRENCRNARDKAIVDLLYSTGMRVSELTNLNKEDLDMENRECIVLGKGNKQRIVYFDAKAKLSIQKYLETRLDKQAALFVSSNRSAHRLSKSTIEQMIKKLGKSTLHKRIYPHKFRRTLATNAINKGMPIEQVQKLLGHAKIDTTMHYAFVNQNNVKLAHRRFIC